MGEKERQMRVKNKNLASRLKSEEEEVTFFSNPLGPVLNSNLIDF